MAQPSRHRPKLERTGSTRLELYRLRRVRAAIRTEGRRVTEYTFDDWDAAFPGGLGGPPAAMIPVGPENVTAGPLGISPEPTPLHGEPTWRTLADIDDSPVEDLILGMIEHGPNLFSALGGVGKGSTVAYLCGECIKAGIRPMIYDPENRPREWARRVSGLGIDRGQVIYLQPHDLPRSLLGRPLWDIAPHLGAVARATSAGILFVDSVLPSVGLGEDRLKSDPQVPYLYVAALDALDIPSVSLGHPPKGQPEGEPFGSVAWTNAMRLTWYGTQAEAEGHVVRWRPRKRNERGHIPGVLLTFDYGLDNRLESVTRTDDEESTRDWVLATLVPGARAVADMAEDLYAEMAAPPAGELERIKERLGKTLRRMSKQGWVEKFGTTGSKVQWALRERPR